LPAFAARTGFLLATTFGLPAALAATFALAVVVFAFPSRCPPRLYAAILLADTPYVLQARK
jgi:hypothetical protein